MSNNSDFFSKKVLGIQIFYWLEAFTPLSMILYLVIAAVSGELFGVKAINFISSYFVTLQLIILFGILFYFLYGTGDFRFKMFLHLAIFTMTVVMIMTMVPEIGTVDLFDPERTKPVLRIYLDFALMGTLPLIGILGTVLAIFNLLSPLEEEIEVIYDELNNEDLTKRIEKDQVLNDTIMGRIARLINTMMDQISIIMQAVGESISRNSATIQSIAASTEEVNAAAEQVSSTSQSMSQAASHQAEMISHSVEEIGRIDIIVGQIVDQIQQNSTVISQIALQTNILALNAGIEASRAGDYGRGFAVVAENVRRLSEESKNAAEKITIVADNISSQLNDSFGSIRIQIEEVAALSQETAASAEEVAAAAEEVQSSMESIVGAINDLSVESQQLDNKLRIQAKR